MIVFLDQLKTFLMCIQEFVSFLLIFSQLNSFLFYQQPLYACAFLLLKLEMWSSSSCTNLSCWVGTSAVEDLPNMHRTLGLLPSKTKITRKTKHLPLSIVCPTSKEPSMATDSISSFPFNTLVWFFLPSRLCNCWLFTGKIIGLSRTFLIYFFAISDLLGSLHLNPFPLMFLILVSVSLHSSFFQSWCLPWHHFLWVVLALTFSDRTSPPHPDDDVEGRLC